MKREDSRGRLLLRKFAVAVLVLLGAVSGVLIILTVSPGERLLKRLAETYLGDFLGQEVRIGRLETNLASRLEIADVSVFKVEGADTLHSLDLRSARAEYGLRGLIRRRLMIDRVSVDGLSLAINRDSVGAYNFPFLRKDEAADTTAAEGSAFNVVLGEAEVVDSRLRYRDQSVPGVDVLAEAVNARVAGKGNGAYVYSLGADSVVTHLADVTVPVSDLLAQGTLMPGGLRIDSLRLFLPDLSLAGSAEVLTGSGPGSLSGRIRVTGNPGALARSLIEQAADTTVIVSADLDLILDLEGSIEEPRARCDLNIASLNVDKLYVPEIRMLATAGRESVLVDELNVEALGGGIVAEASMALDSLLSYDASIVIDRIDIAEIQRMVSADSAVYAGSIYGTATVSGRARVFESWDVGADLGIAMPTYRSTSVQPLTLRLRYKEREGNLEIRQGESNIAAVIALGELGIDGRFTADIPDLEPMVGMFVPDLAGRVNIEGRVRGRLDSLVARADIISASIQYRDFPVDTIRGGIEYDGGTVSLFDLRFAGTIPEVDTLAPPFGLRGLAGSLHYEGYVDGPVESPAGEVQASLRGLRYGKTRVDKGSLRVSLREGRVDLESLELERDFLLLRGTGTYLMARSAGEATIELYEMPPDPTDSTGVPNEGRGDLGGAPGQAQPAGSVVLQFDLSDTSSIAVELSASRIGLRSLYSMATGDTSAAGMLDLAVRASGPLRRPDAHVAFHVAAPGYGLVSVDSLTGTASIADNELRLERLNVHLGEKTHTASATLALDAGPGAGYAVSEAGPFKGWARGDGLDMDLLSPLIGEKAKAAGRLSYDLRWNGTLRAPRPEGMISLEAASFAVEGDVPAVTDVGMVVTLADSLLTVDRMVGVIKDTPFSIQASIVSPDWHDFTVDAKVSLAAYGTVAAQGKVSPESLDLKARIVDLGLEVFEPLSPAITRLSGTLATDVYVSGPPSGPRIRGELVVRGLYLESPEFSPPLNDGVVKIKFEGTTVSIDSVFVRAGEGHAIVSGSMSHEKGSVRDIAIAAKVSKLTLTRPKVLVAAVESADLRYAGKDDRYLLDGDVVMGETRLVMNFDPRSILPYARSARTPEQELPAVLKKTRFDVRLRDSRNLWVDNNVARIRSHAELNLIGSFAQPNATGRVSIEEGYVKFLDRKFEIIKGVVDFVDRDRLNPIIDLRAESRVKSYRALATTIYTVNLDIVGSLDEVRVDLTSDPPLDRSSILSLLTLGVTRDQLADTGDDAPTTGEVLRGRAEELTGRVVTGYVTRSVADLVGLKDLSIEGNLFNPRGEQGAFLVASKDLYEKVEVTYSTNIGHFNENTVKMNYRLSRRFALEGETDQRGRAGIDLKYRVKFQ